MKVIPRKVLRVSNILRDIPLDSSTVSSVSGTTKEFGINYKNALVVLYEKNNLKPLLVVRSDENGNYKFLGIPSSLTTFVVTFDLSKKYNAVIQDNIIPR